MYSNRNPQSLETDNRTVSTKVRYSNVDIVKAIAIFCVIWSHTDSPDDIFNMGNFGNITFFFCSGFFFKINTPFPDFFSKRFWRLLTPFFIFYLLSYPFRMIVYLWDNRTLESFDWSRIMDLFLVEGRSDYLSLNVPLWFLLAIFVIHILGYFLFRLPRPLIFATALASIIFGNELFAWPTPFMINNAMKFYGFFAFGYLYGKDLLKCISNGWNKTYGIIFLLSVLTLLFSIIYLQTFHLPDPHYWVFPLEYMSCAIILLCVVTPFQNQTVISRLTFLGVNSLIILCMHLFILVPVDRFSYLLTRSHHPLIGLMIATVTTLLMIPIIIFINRKLPLLAGNYKTR